MSTLTVLATFFSTAIAQSPALQRCQQAPAALVHADELLLDRLVADTEVALIRQGIPAQVTARRKSDASIQAKMARKGLPFEQVIDRIGLRVIVDDVDQCYEVRDMLTTRYGLLPGEFDDYIAQPKANGYQSLHVPVQVGLLGEVAEFQVRTSAMHIHAEDGDAAHWRYKLATA